MVGWGGGDGEVRWLGEGCLWEGAFCIVFCIDCITSMSVLFGGASSRSLLQSILSYI